MERTVQNVPLRDQQQRDLSYWLSRPMAERVAAVEVLRRQAHASLPDSDAEPRLQKVLRVSPRRGR